MDEVLAKLETLAGEPTKERNSNPVKMFAYFIDKSWQNHFITLFWPVTGPLWLLLVSLVLSRNAAEPEDMSINA